MKKIFLLFVLLVSVAFSTIDECKTDVYFGNGILTEKKDAIYNTFEVLKPAIQSLYGSEEEMKKYIGKVDYAYNRTDGKIIDLLESMVQKIDGTGIENVHKYIKRATLLARLMTQKAHDSDLSRQVAQYKESIKKGHKILR